MKFKIGDRVKRTSMKEREWNGVCNRLGLNPDGEFIVTECLDSDVFLKGHFLGWCDRYFDLSKTEIQEEYI